MEKREASHSLPETLVEKVIAMMPFPSILKARSLSKSWLARFSSSSSQEGAEKSLAISFQKQVGEWSSKWETFSPVYITTEDFMAYSQASHSWPRLPLRTFLPEELLVRGLIWQIEGPLLYGFAPQQTRFNNMKSLFVVNIITRCWRELPPLPIGPMAVLCHKLVIYPALEKYKVILVGCPDHYRAQVYDSKSDAWSSKILVVSNDFKFSLYFSAYLNGVLYMVGYGTPGRLLAFNVEEGTLEELRLSFDDGDVQKIGTTLNIVVCNVNWLMIVTKPLYHENVDVDTVEVFRIDLGSLGLLCLAQGPPPALNLRWIPPWLPVGHGNRIFFKVKASSGMLGTGHSPVLAYNVDDDVWGFFPLPTFTSSAQGNLDCLESSFEPGFGPFLAV